jgi:3-mercaptopyruvate sulfurtransferase SseA
MSNTRRPREWNGGRLTRPRAKWHGHARGIRNSPYAAGMNQQGTGLMSAMIDAMASQARDWARAAQRLGSANRRSG